VYGQLRAVQNYSGSSQGSAFGSGVARDEAIAPGLGKAKLPLFFALDLVAVGVAAVVDEHLVVHRQKTIAPGHGPVPCPWLWIAVHDGRSIALPMLAVAGPGQD